MVQHSDLNRFVCVHLFNHVHLCWWISKTYVHIIFEHFQHRKGYVTKHDCLLKGRLWEETIQVFKASFGSDRDGRQIKMQLNRHVKEYQSGNGNQSPGSLSLVLLLTFIEHLLHSRYSAVNWGCKTAPQGSYPWDHSLGSCINFWSLPARWQVLDRKRCIEHSRRGALQGSHMLQPASSSLIRTEGRTSSISRKGLSTCRLAVHLCPSFLSSNQRWASRKEVGKEVGVLLSASV